MTEKTEIKFDSRNYRIHDERNKQLIEKSLKDCGAGRSILLDNSGSIIAGNGIYEQAQKLGLEVEIIHSDGKKLIAVQRDDIEPDSKKRQEMAIMDNTTSDASRQDIELMKQDLTIPELQEMGVPCLDDWQSDIDTINKIKAEDGIAPARVVLEFDQIYKEEIVDIIQKYCQEHEIAVEIK